MLTPSCLEWTGTSVECRNLVPEVQGSILGQDAGLEQVTFPLLLGYLSEIDHIGTQSKKKNDFEIDDN